MRRRFARPLLPAPLLAAALAGCTADAPPEVTATLPDVEWRTYGNDPGGKKYSPLQDIDRTNVARLRVAWTARAGDFPPEMFEAALHRSGDEREDGVPVDPRAGAACGSCHGTEIRFETTPLMRDGTLFLSTPRNRVLALDPADGTERWSFDPGIDLEIGYDEDLISRGVSAWDDPEARAGSACARRIFLATIDARLFALDAADGAPCADFGEGGQVRLDRGVALQGREVDVGSYLVTSPPAVVGNVVVVGSAIGDNRRKDVESGVVRAFDARSGAMRWSFDPIPRTREHPAWDAWTPEGAASTGAANVWSIISVDPERDLVLLPTGSAAPDFYGGDRPGRNDHANSVVAVRGSSGEVVWSFQVVHHDLWDYDVASQPVLIDFPVSRELPATGQGLHGVRGPVEPDSAVPAVVVGTKMGHVFVLHRETGKPLLPVEERAVPASDVPGEAAWPTQPFPLGTPPLHETLLTPDSVFGVSEEERAHCRQLITGLRNEGVFTPPSLGGTLLWPGFAGGMNWDGMGWDPERGLLVVPVKRLAMLVQLHPRVEFEAREDRVPGREYTGQEGTPYGMSRMPLLSPSGLPCSPPPWAKLVAVELATGRIAWQRPLGALPAPEGGEEQPSAGVEAPVTEGHEAGPGEVEEGDPSREGVEAGPAAASGGAGAEPAAASEGAGAPLASGGAGAGAGRTSEGPSAGPPPEAWGSIAFGGPLITAGGLTFIAAGQDDHIRAFDTETGELLWEHELPAGGQAAPMTYRYRGRQYVVIAAGGRAGIGSPGDWIVAFALP